LKNRFDNRHWPDELKVNNVNLYIVSVGDKRHGEDTRIQYIMQWVAKGQESHVLIFIESHY